MNASEGAAGASNDAAARVAAVVPAEPKLREQFAGLIAATLPRPKNLPTAARPLRGPMPAESDDEAHGFATNATRTQAPAERLDAVPLWRPLPAEPEGALVPTLVPKLEQTLPSKSVASAETANAATIADGDGTAAPTSAAAVQRWAAATASGNTRLDHALRDATSRALDAVAPEPLDELLDQVADASTTMQDLAGGAWSLRLRLRPELLPDSELEMRCVGTQLTVTLRSANEAAWRSLLAAREQLMQRLRSRGLSVLTPDVLLTAPGGLG